MMPAMKRYWLCLTLAACSAGDDTTTGANAECAEGGALTSCPDSTRTPEDACWRLVDCGVIPVSSGTDNHRFDWGDCIGAIEGADTAAEQLIIACIAQSSCDALKVRDNPDGNDIACFHFGGE